jgi:hypothetical protein
MRQPDESDAARLGAERRDVLADDRDESADQRDACSVERDSVAALRDRVAEERADAATDRAQDIADRLWRAGREISRRQHLATTDVRSTDLYELSPAARAQLHARAAEQDQDAALGSDALRSTLDEIRETFDCGRAIRAAAAADRVAAAADRSAAAVDRAAAARDRDDTARDRQQAAIERELVQEIPTESSAPPSTPGPGSRAIVESRQRIADSRSALDRRSPH